VPVEVGSPTPFTLIAVWGYLCLRYILLPMSPGRTYPGRHRRGADRTVLADQIDDAPTAVALLQVSERQRGDLGTPQAAAEKKGENSSVAQSTKCRDMRGAQQRLRLFL
jgi:hypothetical protein